MGITVKYTVDPDDDTDVRLTTRYQIANKIKQQNPGKHCILISVHANAAGSGREWMNARGWCAYTTKGQNNSDKLADCIYDAAEAVLPLDDIKIRYDKTDGDKDYESNFTIIYGSNMPAVLVENLFYDNVDDCEFLNSDYGKDILSTVMAQGIFDFITKVWKL